MCRKRMEGGFVNPKHEMWEMRLGLIALGILVVIFFTLIGQLFLG